MNNSISKRYLQPILIFLCMCPFLFQLPGFSSDMQPYATIISLLIIIFFAALTYDTIKNNFVFSLLLITAVIATALLFINDINMLSFRGYFNHLSLFAVPLAVYILNIKGGYNESVIKKIILIWLIVSLIQMFVTRSFLSFLISNARFASSSRGVIGLASEPSFYGVACFYFLNLAYKFEKDSMKYMLLLTLMAVAFAQSSLGVLFVACFWVGYLAEHIKSQKGVLVFVFGIIFVSVGIYLLSKYGSDTRLYSILNLFQEGGTENLINNDESTMNRVNAIVNAVKTSAENYFLPIGYNSRIGSGYGGFLCEMGIFAFVEIICLSYCICILFKNKFAKCVYFILVTFLLFQNVQIGNPQLLMIAGYNLYFKKINERRRVSDAFRSNKKSF